MCGICGFNWEDKELLKGMTSIIRHRGPDSGGLYTNQNISLGHRRLSIIDLSAAGRQPMCNKEGNVWITYNGEIYNFPEIRKVLEEKKYRFDSNTDTEVVLHAYQELGEGCLQYFDGMFAFAIWDQDKKELFLARDRLGIKPLYYYWDGQKFIFASEIKALLLAGIPRKVNLRAAKQYLQLRYIPGEDTLFKGIKKLLPGHTLTLKDGKIEIKQFWNLPVPKINKSGLTETAECIKRSLSSSVGKRLIADVPVGVYLSGGIDSAAITAFAAQFQKEPVKTFSVGFDYDNKVDELNKAKAIAQHLQTDHHEIVVDGNISPLLPKLIWHLDMPHGDPVIIPQFKLSQLASQKVKVVLSGEGADELFAGYVQYKTFLQARKTFFLPKTLTTNMASAVPIKILDKFFDYPASVGEKGKEKVIEFLDN
ncbi:asparagine synthase (glutamine-hydrolyzing), partial [Candidatus Woesearchaeota archaeon]|nr:asparagine synthase (glutamine-hydrolyzing) [Candidatus Woesearchaeota archaeon]